MSDHSDFPHAQVAAQQTAQRNIAAILSEVRRDIAQPLLDEAGQQLIIASAPQGDDLLRWEHAKARALLTALICVHTAIEAWLNRTLEDDFPIVWPEVDRMEFMAKVRFLAKLMTQDDEAPRRGRHVYGGVLNPGGQVFDGLQELNTLRNKFVHYKSERVSMGSPNDPYEKLNKLPSIIKKLNGLSTYGLVIPKV